MADVVAPPTAPGRVGGVMATIRGIPAFYRAVVAEMKKVTWPEPADVRRATIAIIVFVLILGLVIYLLDVALQGVFANLIPRLFVGR